MKAPLLAVLKGSPITRVMEMLQPHLTWDTEEPGSPDDLWDLETGKEYAIKVRTPYTLKWCGQEYELKEGWNDRVLWRPWVTFSPGQSLTQTHWDWALSVLERVGFDRLLGVADVRQVKVMSKEEMTGLVYYPLRGTIYQASRALLFLDVAPDPPSSVFAEMVAHECIHMLQTDNPPLSDSWRRAEFQAYAISDLLHRLVGDGLNIFNYPGYIQAYELARTEWP